MLGDLTTLDPLAWDALKKALNQRVVIGHIRLLPSRRNRVWVVETDVRPVVVKRFLSGRCGHEFETLLQARLAGLDVPYPLWSDGTHLVTEYVAGDPCELMINHMFSNVAAEAMGTWLAQFHSRLREGNMVKIIADAVLSNFIFVHDRVYGVDLEDSRVGDPLDDVGQLAANILGSEPLFTPVKFDLCLQMIRSYGRVSGQDIVEKARPHVAKHLKLDARNKPLFRRTLVSAAKSLERGWPRLA
ncbi:MAG: hypothetical protein A3K60_01670 [Euryarchaeota archaeon RBG_19FT_COMBO_56_21]|nr:MAG: hypothetical protein A3K60_01670 [Euryarchaeota archaeon RBG_19FT_COMBO_56_21]